MSAGEKQGVRERIEKYQQHLMKVDQKLANDPQKAREIARKAALRVEHGGQG